MANFYGKDRNVDFAASKLMSFGKSFSRMNGQPLDESEVWYNKAELEAFAAGNSAYVGMNKTYFCLFFKKHYGMSFTEYLNQKRLETASVMLLKPDASIADVAVACGYPTVTYFNRIFRKFKGMTPSEYRKSKQI